MKNKHLHVRTSQGYAGELVKESQYVFNYDTDAKASEISLSMPLTAASYVSSILPGVIRQNLPEGFLLSWIRENFAKTMPMDDFNMLTLTGQNTIGRVQCHLERDSAYRTQSGEDLSELLAWRGTEELFAHLANKYAAMSGISGVQPKVLMPQMVASNAQVIEKSSMRAPDLIVKAAGHDFDGLAENEFHCMTIAKRAGLDVPDFWLSDDRGLFVVRRFDLDSQGRYLGFEDMTALTGCQNDAKYSSSYEIVAKVIKTFASDRFRQSSLEALFKSITLSIALRNGDAHLKNFGLLYTDPTQNDIRLSPVFDIVNTTSYIRQDKLALNMAKSKSWPHRATLIEFGHRHCMVDRPGELIDRIIDTAATYMPEIECGEIWADMKGAIELGCLTLQS